MAGKKQVSDKMVAVYAGSFDPVTNGHLDIIYRAAKIFPLLIVAVGESVAKTAIFSADERVAFLKKLLAKIPNVTVASYQGLTVAFAKKNAAKVLVRGLRSGEDFTHEMAIARMNQHLGEDLETIFIPTNPALFHLSSTMVKEVAKNGGDLSPFVPSLVLQKLTEKLHKSR